MLLLFSNPSPTIKIKSFQGSSQGCRCKSREESVKLRRDSAMDVRPWAILLMGFYSSICSAIHPEFHRFFLLSLSLWRAQFHLRKPRMFFMWVCNVTPFTSPLFFCFNVRCLSVFAKQLMYWFGRFPF
jgi:hypothetical protein